MVVETTASKCDLLIFFKENISFYPTEKLRTLAKYTEKSLPGFSGADGATTSKDIANLLDRTTVTCGVTYLLGGTVLELISIRRISEARKCSITAQTSREGSFAPRGGGWWGIRISWIG